MRYALGGLTGSVRRPGQTAAAAKQRLTSALNKLTGAGWPDDTAIWVMSGYAGILSSIIAHPDAKARWRAEGFQVPVGEGDAKLAALERARNPAPGPSRALHLDEGMRTLADDLADAVLPRLRRLGVRRLAVSAAGVWGHYPYEAMPVADGFLGSEFEVFYLPRSFSPRN